MGEGRDGHRPQWAPDAESERSPALWLSHGTTGLCRTPAPGRTVTSSRSQWGRRSADSCTFEPPSFPAPHRPRRRQGRPAALPLSAPDVLRSASQPLPRCSSAPGSATSVRPAVKRPSPRVSSAVPPRFRGPVRSAAPLLPSGAPPLAAVSRPRAAASRWLAGASSSRSRLQALLRVLGQPRSPLSSPRALPLSDRDICGPLLLKAWPRSHLTWPPARPSVS